MTRLGILLSGRGSNFLSIDRAIREGRLTGAEIAVVVSNVPEAPGLAAARALGYPGLALESRGRKRGEHDEEMAELLRAHGVELVCLAGYMRLLSPSFVARFRDRILNIHPSLLPAFPGLHAQQQAWEYGVGVAGCTVHFVDEQLDHGVIVLQRAVPAEEGDTPEALAERILEAEHQVYPEAIARVLSGRYRMEGRRYVPVAAATTEA